MLFVFSVLRRICGNIKTLGSYLVLTMNYYLLEAKQVS